jgi:hypothetical protein
MSDATPGSLSAAAQLATPLARVPQRLGDRLSSQINAMLPAGYFAEPNVQFDIEIDVALLARLLAPSAAPSQDELYAAANNPTSRSDETVLDIWPEGLELGRPLPALPLWLLGGSCLAVDLEAAYQRKPGTACPHHWSLTLVTPIGAMP